jgi:CheY-like chemotaxis protein
MTLPSPPPLRVCLLGFRGFEGSALASALRLATQRQPSYQPVADAHDSDLVVVDADQSEALAQVVRAGLIERTVYIGAHLPDDASGWLTRPIDTHQLLHELDQLAAMHFGITPAVSAPSAAQAPGHMTRALLVDDSEIALRFLESRLQALGVQTERAQGSAKALALLSQRAYDMVFLDVELGESSELDGLALCQHIKRHHHHAGSALEPTVVMVSAHHSELDRARGALAGCDAYLAKPLDEQALRRLFHHHSSNAAR